GGRYRNSAPAAFMSCSTLGPLWLDRLSMTTMSPFERVGTRHFSTHSSNEAALIGRSKAFWATRPRRRRPATSVTVLQWTVARIRTKSSHMGSFGGLTPRLLALRQRERQ